MVDWLCGLVLLGLINITQSHELIYFYMEKYIGKRGLGSGE